MKSVLRIAELRNERGLSQAALAKQIGVSPASVARWEIGTRNPELNSLLAMARVFSCQPGDLFHRLGA